MRFGMPSERNGKQFQTPPAISVSIRGRPPVLPHELWQAERSGSGHFVSVHLAVGGRLPDTKTGGRAVLLAPSAVRRLLQSLPRDEDKPWVIAGRKPGSHLTDLQHPSRRIREKAELDDVRIHDLCHSFASRALALGERLPMIAKLLGHTQVQTTARYAHLALDTTESSAARIGDSIDSDLEAMV